MARVPLIDRFLRSRYLSLLLLGIVTGWGLSRNHSGGNVVLAGVALAAMLFALYAPRLRLGHPSARKSYALLVITYLLYLGALGLGGYQLATGQTWSGGLTLVCFLPFAPLLSRSTRAQLALIKSGNHECRDATG